MDKRFNLKQKSIIILIILIPLILGFSAIIPEKPDGVTRLTILTSQEKAYKIVKKFFKKSEHEITQEEQPGYIELYNESMLILALDGNFKISRGTKLLSNSSIWFESKSENATIIYIHVNQTSFDVKEGEVNLETKKEERSITSEVELMEKIIDKLKELNIPIDNTEE